MKSRRIGLGRGRGIGYKNLVRTDPTIHSRAAKGQKTYDKGLVRRLERGLTQPKWVEGLSWSARELEATSVGMMTEAYRATYPLYAKASRIPASHMMGASRELAKLGSKTFRFKQNHVATNIRDMKGQKLNDEDAHMIEKEFREYMDDEKIRFDSDWSNENSKWKTSQFRHTGPVNRFTQTGRRTNILSWDDWVKVNNAFNNVMEKNGISANIQTLGGKFKIRKGQTAYTESDWKDLAYQNVGSQMKPVERRNYIEKIPKNPIVLKEVR